MRAATRFLMVVMVLVCGAVQAEATTYYLSPSGSNGNNGLTSGTPWLTFVFAQANGWGCTDTLILLDGTYGTGTATGVLDVNTLVCTLGNEAIVQAQNPRQAHIHTDGSSRPVFIHGGSAYIKLIDLRLSAADNISFPGTGELIYIHDSDNVTGIGILGHNPNRYCNCNAIQIELSDNARFENTEVYNYHRHVFATAGATVVIHNAYANPVIGGRSDVNVNGNGSFGGDGLVAFYPCDHCLMENVVGDFWPKTGELVEINALGGTSVGNRVLNSIAHNMWTGNCVRIDARGNDTNQMPHDTIVDNVSCYGNSTSGTGLTSLSAEGTIVRHVSLLNLPIAHGFAASLTGELGDGIYSFFIENSLAYGIGGSGFLINPAVQTWTGTNTNGFGNGFASPGYLNYDPASSSNWVNRINGSTGIDPALGSCRAWIPDASPMKGAGTGGSDVGANILYLYQDGVPTLTKMWNPSTGGLVFCGAIVAGVNDVAGQSCFDVQDRLNINTGGCPFPAGYVTGGSSTGIGRGSKGLGLF